MVGVHRNRCKPAVDVGRAVPRGLARLVERSNNHSLVSRRSLGDFLTVLAEMPTQLMQPSIHKLGAAGLHGAQPLDRRLARGAEWPAAVLALCGLAVSIAVRRHRRDDLGRRFLIGHETAFSARRLYQVRRDTPSANHGLVAVRVASRALSSGRPGRRSVAGAGGFEPPTVGFKGRCSTAELRARAGTAARAGWWRRAGQGCVDQWRPWHWSHRGACMCRMWHNLAQSAIGVLRKGDSLWGSEK